jgi:3-hydroxyisobutyrate dehydrogenase
MIAFLGTGLLGANFVRAFRRRNEAVQVWNRTPEKARALHDAGAVAFDSPAGAVRGATRVHLALVDDTTVDDVLAEARAGLSVGTAIVDHTTTSPAPTAERVRHWTNAGFQFQHAPVFMGPQNALNATGTMLASGVRETFDALAPALEQMTGTLVYLGDDPARAAAIKLLGNLFYIATIAGIADMFMLGKALGVPADQVSRVFEWFNPGTIVPARAARLREGQFAQPSWTLAMARKDTRLMIEAAASNGAALAVMPAIAATMDRWIAAGHSAEDWMVIGKDAVT